MFDRKTFEKLQNIDIEEMGYEDDEEEEEFNDDDIVVRRDIKKKLKKPSSDDEDEDENMVYDSEEEKIRKIDKMADEIEGLFEHRNEYKGEIDRRQEKKDKKKKALIEQQRLKKEELKVETALDNEDLIDEIAADAEPL